MGKSEMKEVKYIDIVKTFGNGSHLIVPKGFEGKRVEVSIKLIEDQECKESETDG